MFIPNVRYDRNLGTWRDSQNTYQRGASRVMPKKGLVPLFVSVLDYCKIAIWLLLATVLAVALYNGTNKLVAYANQPITKVVVLGDLGYVDQQSLQSRMEPLVNRGFLSVDLEHLRQTLEKTPWVSHVEVERVWPNELKIQLNGKHPVARWGDNSLLNNVGESFVTKDIAAYQSLPLLDGPNYAQSQVMQQYQIISQLLRPVNFSIISLELNERGSWSLITNTGLKLVLGRGDLVEKIRRFTKAYDANLKEKMDNIAYLDLRYNSGLAVGWKDPSKEMAAGSSNMVARQ